MRALFGQQVELRFCGKRCIREARSRLRPGHLLHQLGQPMISLRPEHQVDLGCPLENLLAFRLRHAAGHRKQHAPAGRLPLVFEAPQPSKLRKDLLRGLLANVAGVEDDHVGAAGAIHRGVAERRQDIRHAGGVVDVHLTTVGLDEKFFGQDRVRCSGSPSTDPPRGERA